MIEGDITNDEGKGVRIPCFMEGKQTSDLIIRGGDVSRVQSFVSPLIDLLNFIPAVASNKYFVAVTLSTQFALSAGSTFGDDRDAIYTVDTFNRINTNTYDKSPFSKSTCNAI